MKLIDAKTGEKLKGVILRLTEKEVEKLKGHKGFTFDWSTESQNHVFIIRLQKQKELLGIMSIIDVPEELRIHINLIESSKNYRGKGKSIQNIPGCLIGYACRISFKRGYDGFVSLTPKTMLVRYYQETYGFIEMGNQLAVFEGASNSLIQKYIGDEEI